MVAALAHVVTPVVILHFVAEAIGFQGLGARQWDLNVDVPCRRLLHRSVTFVQPHPWEKIQYDDEKRALAIANNTHTLMDVLRRAVCF